jgi:hypothetical protein
LEGVAHPPEAYDDKDGPLLERRPTFISARCKEGIMSATVDPKALATKGEALYATGIKARVEPAHFGEYVAIEVDSGEYFLGRTLIEAGEKARATYPDRVFHFIKIGSPVAQRRRGDFAGRLCR